VAHHHTTAMQPHAAVAHSAALSKCTCASLVLENAACGLPCHHGARSPQAACRPGSCSSSLRCWMKEVHHCQLQCAPTSSTMGCPLRTPYAHAVAQHSSCILGAKERQPDREATKRNKRHHGPRSAATLAMLD